MGAAAPRLDQFRRRGCDGRALVEKIPFGRAAAIGQVILILLGGCLAQYPYLVIPDLEIHPTAAPPQTLRLLLIALGLGALLLFPSLLYLFYIFKPD